MMLRLLENAFVSQRIEAKLSPRFLSSLLQVEGYYWFLPNKVFENLFFPSREGEDCEAENMIKIKLARILVTIRFCCAIIEI